MDKEKWNLPFDRRFLVIGLVLAVLIAAVAVGFNRNSFYDPLSQENQQGPGAPEPPPGEEDGEEGEPPEKEPDNEEPGELEKNSEEEKAADNAEIRKLLEKGQKMENFSYTALFTSSSNEFSYDYYKRENLTKLVTKEEDGSQSITISDGSTTVSYTLPDKTGFRLKGPGDEMDVVPSIAALLGENYVYTTAGTEKVSGLECRVVETEDEFGVLKLWISKTLGLPIKYLGTYDSGWYGLTLSNIQTGHADESLFAIPGDILIVNDGVSQTYDEIISGVSDEINAGQQ